MLRIQVDDHEGTAAGNALADLLLLFWQTERTRAQRIPG